MFLKKFRKIFFGALIWSHIIKNFIIVQFPEGKNLSYSEGKINNINNYEFNYDASTKPGSSGSPILLKNTTKVIGIHKKGNKSNKHNYGTSIYSIIQTLQFQNSNNKEREKKQIKSKSNTEIQNQKYNNNPQTIETFREHQRDIPKYIPPQNNEHLYIGQNMPNFFPQRFYTFYSNCLYNISEPIYPPQEGFISNSSSNNGSYGNSGNIGQTQGYGYQIGAYQYKIGVGQGTQIQPQPQYVGGNQSIIYPEIKQGYQTYNSGNTQIKVQKSSIHMHNSFYYAEMINGECSICHKILENKPGYKCDECNLILGMECAAKINKIKGCHPHPLCLVIGPNWICNCCRKNFANTCSFRCKSCDFDICGQCYAKY